MFQFQIRYLSHLIDLQEMIGSMEQAIGLDVLPKEERLIIYAMASVTRGDTRTFKISEIKKHRLCSGISHATFHRHLNRILERGGIRLSEGRKAGEYVFLEGGDEQYEGLV